MKPVSATRSTRGVFAAAPRDPGVWPAASTPSNTTQVSREKNRRNIRRSYRALCPTGSEATLCLEFDPLAVLRRANRPPQILVDARAQRVLCGRLAVNEEGLLRRRLEAAEPPHDLVRVGVRRHGVDALDCG